MPANKRGRPPQITQGQKQAIANKAMGLKQELLAPTPERVRICMPRKTINKTTKKPISDSSIQRVFKTWCHDEHEDDPWQYRNAPQQECFMQTQTTSGKQTYDDHCSSAQRNLLP